MVVGQEINLHVQQYQPVLDKQTADTSRLPLGKGEFEGIFRTQFQDSGIKFSAHAQSRIEQRNVELDGDRLQRLNEGMARAKAKGSKETLLLMDDIAMVISAKNNTVITVMSGSSVKENVFTNIDSAVVV